MMHAGGDIHFMNYLFTHKNKRTRRLIMVTSLIMMYSVLALGLFIWLWYLFGLMEPITILIFAISLASFAFSSGIAMGYQYRWQEEQGLFDDELDTDEESNA